MLSYGEAAALGSTNAVAWWERDQSDAALPVYCITFSQSLSKVYFKSRATWLHGMNETKIKRTVRSRHSPYLQHLLGVYDSWKSKVCTKKSPPQGIYVSLAELKLSTNRRCSIVSSSIPMTTATYWSCGQCKQVFWNSRGIQTYGVV